MANEISKLITPDGVSHDISDAQSRTDLLSKAQLVLISSNDYNNLSNDAKHDLTKAYFVYDADPYDSPVLISASDYFTSTANVADFKAYKIGKLIVVERLSIINITYSNNWFTFASTKDAYKAATSSIRWTFTTTSKNEGPVHIGYFENGDFITALPTGTTSATNIFINQFSYVAPNA